jgi:hypothetical protein
MYDGIYMVMVKPAVCHISAASLKKKTWKLLASKDIQIFVFKNKIEGLTL